MSSLSVTFTRRAAIRDQRWRDHAACRGADPELFFPAPPPAGRGKAVREAIAKAEVAAREAKAICACCPVRLECLRDAMESGEQGILGGHTHAEREALKVLNASKAS